MLNLSQKTLSKVKKYLLRQQKEVNERIKEIDKNDQIMDSDAPEAEELGTASWTAEVHSRFDVLKNDLVGFSGRIKKSLLNLKKGTYGKCENCGKEIEAARLEALPTATICLSCSKKSSKK